MKKVNNKGFTLAELLIVVAIIAVMVAIAIPTFSAQMERSREGVDLSAIRNAYSEVATYFMTDKVNEKNISKDQAIEFKQFSKGWVIDTADFPCEGIDEVFGDDPELPGDIAITFNKTTDEDTGEISITITKGQASVVRGYAKKAVTSDTFDSLKGTLYTQTSGTFSKLANNAEFNNATDYYTREKFISADGLENFVTGTDYYTGTEGGEFTSVDTSTVTEPASGTTYYTKSS